MEFASMALGGRGCRSFHKFRPMQQAQVHSRLRCFQDKYQHSELTYFITEHAFSDISEASFTST
jgi:hypothetical protein